MWDKLNKLRQEYLDLGIINSIDYEKFNMVSIVYNSTKIEGCSLDENDTRMLIEKDITAKGKPLKDHLMVKDHFAAFLFLKHQAKKKRKLSVDFIREVNGLTMKNTGGIINTVLGSFDSSKGDLRLLQVYVEKKYFPDYSKVPKLLTALCESVNNKIDLVKGDGILKLSSDLHYNLVNVHPFADGNGRSSRLFMNYIQMYHNEPLVKIFTEDRKEYIEALNKTEEQDNPEIFRGFICNQQIKFYKAEIRKFKEKDSNFRLIL
ncbi:MAG: cell filamentation protein Fic [Bacteroidetes bacterium 4572_114]|nr:MAG: cell filamentation protein Fic [Bacteroidetes bacterium 4572_114]